MAPPDPISLDALLSQADWARNLARRLVRDEHSADDLLQRTWVAALEHPPRGAAKAPRSTLQGWLASVMRNFARQDARAFAPGGTAADQFSFVDADGVATQNFQFEGTMIGIPERCSLVEGRSEVCATEDTARTLLLYKEGREVARVPVQLMPGKLTVLRP